MNDTNVFDQLPNCTRGHSDYELEECDEGRILDIGKLQKLIFLDELLYTILHTFDLFYSFM